MPASTPTTLLWFRRDLRLADNPALIAAMAEGRPLVALCLLDEVTPGRRPLGKASRWWLHHSLVALDADLRSRGNRLLLRRGAAETVLPALAAECGAHQVHWNRAHEPSVAAQDAALGAALQRQGVQACRHEGNDLLPPDALRTGSGGPYKVFTPFWHALQEAYDPPLGLAAPSSMPAPRPLPASDLLGDWRLLEGLGAFGTALGQHWSPGEAAAQATLAQFSEEALPDYNSARERPGVPGTSRLSPHLTWGELSPHAVWRAAQARADDAASTRPAVAASASAIQRQLGWKAFARSLLHHWPRLPTLPWRESFAQFPWRDDADALAAWQAGQTGYPWVDAGQRELLATGFVHNRVRMAAASFLSKHLLLPWQRGEAWYWEHLVDADPASNALNWQWVAGCGPDAAPYFRIFNPVLQSKRFDPQGDYLRRWVPELAALPDKALHAPWMAPTALLRQSGVALGTDYPLPMVDHGPARQRALAAYGAMRSGE